MIQKKVFARVDVANADGTMTPTWSLAIVEVCIAVICEHILL